MKRVMVLGAGRVGHVIARDLSSDKDVELVVADRRGSLLSGLAEQEESNVKTVIADLGRAEAVTELVADCDLVVGALPGSLGFTALQGVVAAGKACVDISFMPEDPATLQGLAVETGAVVLYDFGVAPGMSNLLAAREAARLTPARHIGIMVGGLPRKRTHPWEYSAPFSPEDVIEEYVRPARIRVNGEDLTRPALTGLEYIDIPGIGTLEAFHSDGLRSLLQSLDCPNMEEKTLRYPGHRDRIKLLSEAGFFDMTPIDVEGMSIAPRKVSLRLLESAWKPDEDSDEFTVMRVAVTGGHAAGGKFFKSVWTLLDYTDRDRNETSMARTTGFPAAIAARRLLVEGPALLEPGLHPPESLATNDDFFEMLISELDKRNVHYLKENDIPVVMSSMPPPPVNS